MDYDFFITVFPGAFLGAFLFYLILILVEDFVVGSEKTSSAMTVTIPVESSSSETMKVISKFIAGQNSLRIDYYNPQTRHIVLNQRMTFQRVGFLYSIKISDDQEKSNIVIGISSKFPFFGPWSEKVVKMHLVGFANTIRAVLYSL